MLKKLYILFISILLSMASAYAMSVGNAPQVHNHTTINDSAFLLLYNSNHELLAMVKQTDANPSFEINKWVDNGTPISEPIDGYQLVKNGDGEVGFRRLANTGSRFIAKSGAELKTHLNSITNKPLGKSYTGKWYRYTGNPNYNPTEIYSGMIDAENRFRKGLYLSETKSGNIIEANSYGGTSGKTLFEISDVEVYNLLDLTDANTIEVLGTTFEQMKLTGVTNAYEYTQEIAIWAKNNGYSGIKFYGAQGGTSSYTNFVIFEQSSINNSIIGSVNFIPW
jgi:hypothetical protein